MPTIPLFTYQSSTNSSPTSCIQTFIPWIAAEASALPEPDPDSSTFPSLVCNVSHIWMPSSHQGNSKHSLPRFSLNLSTPAPWQLQVWQLALQFSSLGQVAEVTVWDLFQKLGPGKKQDI